MKIIASLLLLLFLAFLGATGWLLSHPEDIKKYVSISTQENLQDQFENLLAQEPVSNFTSVQTAVQRAEGFCTPMELPKENRSISQIKKLDIPFSSFSKPMNLVNMSLLCQFSSESKSILIIPLNKANILLRRKIKSPGRLSLLDGSIRIVSDQLHIVGQFPGHDLELSSEGPVELEMQNLNNEATILLQKGKLNASLETRWDTGNLVIPVRVLLNPDTSIASKGKVVSGKKTVNVLPGGLQEVDEIPPATNPPTGAPAKPNTK